jgi:hypothetical protein
MNEFLFKKTRFLGEKDPKKIKILNAKFTHWLILCYLDLSFMVTKTITNLTLNGNKSNITNM